MDGNHGRIAPLDPPLIIIIVTTTTCRPIMRYKRAPTISKGCYTEYAQRARVHSRSFAD